MFISPKEVKGVLYTTFNIGLKLIRNINHSLLKFETNLKIIYYNSSISYPRTYNSIKKHIAKL